MRRRPGSRDVALTTLIDLLVQIVFVFTLILLASGAIEGTPEERGYIPFEDWKTLVSIFDVDPKKSVTEQAKDIEKNYLDVKKRRDDLEKENVALREKINELDKRLTEMEKKRLGAPGFPPCRASNGSEIIVMRARINANGNIIVSLLPGAQDLGLEAKEGAVARALTRVEFQQAFDHWRRHGIAKEPQCKYSAVVQYDPETKAGDYQPSISAILSMFRIQQIIKANG